MGVRKRLPLPIMQKLNPKPKVGQVWRVKESIHTTDLTVMRLDEKVESDEDIFALSLGDWSDKDGFLFTHHGNDRYRMPWNDNAEYEFLSDSDEPPLRWFALCAVCKKSARENDYLCESCRSK